MPSVSKRFTITVPDSVYEDLERLSDQQGRPVANLAAFLVEVGLMQGKTKGDYTLPEQKTRQREERSP